MLFLLIILPVKFNKRKEKACLSTLETRASSNVDVQYSNNSKDTVSDVQEVFATG